MTQPLSLWIFGPVGSGKSRVLQALPLTGFRRIEQDRELEREMRKEHLHFDTTCHTAEEKARFLALRSATAAAAWQRVPEWRAQGENLVFETTGNRPELFAREVEALRAREYATLGCALRTPLLDCLAQNWGRQRVLTDEVVAGSWRAFDTAINEGVYARIFAGDRLAICASVEEAIGSATGWLAAQGKR